MKKRILALALAGVLLFSGCGAQTLIVPESTEKETTEMEKTEEIQEKQEPEASVSVIPEEKEEKQEEEKVEAETSTSEPSVSEPSVSEPVNAFDEEGSVEFVKRLKLGWNLGNTLDATDSRGLDTETSWGVPKTTKEMIHFVKECGFTSIRIPVSWYKHVSGEDFTIDPEWMDRVNEVVDWALEEDFYVIINSHHDCDYYYPSDEKLESSLKYIECIWTQVADRFKDYDEKLIFEAMNEPRLMGTSVEWWFNLQNAEGNASIKCINELNQKFVDVVRSSGGNNDKRFIMVPSYSANPDFALYPNFKFPEDPAGHSILSVHAYTPYDFAGNVSGYSEWTESKKSELGFAQKLYLRFGPQNIGVVIGEFGATNKGNDADRIAWAKDYTEKTSQYGMPCFVWDNMQTGVGAENFGIIDRKNLKVSFPDLLDAYLTYYK